MKKLISTLLAATMLFTATGALAGFAMDDDTAVATTTLSEQKKAEAPTVLEELAELVAAKQADTVRPTKNRIVSLGKSFLKWTSILGATFTTGAIAGAVGLVPALGSIVAPHLNELLSFKAGSETFFSTTVISDAILSNRELVTNFCSGALDLLNNTPSY